MRHPAFRPCNGHVGANFAGRSPPVFGHSTTDPKGLIRQVYAQKEKSAGFMHIQVEPAKAAVPAKLTVTWHDEHGKVLHATSKQGITP